VQSWVGTYLHFRVSDAGQGISHDFLPHVFERFRQADGMPRRTRGGLGLGLSIVKELVELHGGTVEAYSPGEGQGTSVIVSLPIPPLLLEPKDSEATARTEASRPETAWTELGRTMLEGVRLLVVEDDADSREMLVAAFEHCGAKVSAVASAAEGIEVLQLAPPDVLVCDIGLPAEDGHDFIRKVRALEAERGGRIPRWRSRLMRDRRIAGRRWRPASTYTSQTRGACGAGGRRGGLGRPARPGLNLTSAESRLAVPAPRHRPLASNWAPVDLATAVPILSQRR
jgi:hypothetical protein